MYQNFNIHVNKLTCNESGMLFATWNLKDGDIVWAKPRQIVVGFSCRHLRAKAELSMPIWAPWEHLCKVIVRISAPSSTATNLLHLIRAMIPYRTCAWSFDSQIITSIVAAIDLGATYRRHLRRSCDLILGSCLHRTSFRAVASCVYILITWFGRVTPLLILIIWLLVLDVIAAWPTTAMGFITLATWIGLLHCL